MSETLLRTPLYDCHVADGGRMVGFAGYDMPVQYASVIAEAKAVRESVGMFDVSHMARLGLVGQGTLTFLERVTTNDVASLGNGVGQYSLLPNNQGGVVDDIIVYRVDEHEYQMVVNAANHVKDLAWLKSNNAEGIEIDDETESTFMIAVQGPKAIDTLCGALGGIDALREAPAFGVTQTELGGIPVFAARSGYTGEDGYELIGPAGLAEELWNGLKAAGVIPCGLAARDTLRVEAGLPLYGHELTDEINPIETGLGWVVSKTKSFLGSEPINEARANGTARKLLGIKLGSKRLMMPGMAVSVDATVVGEVTSGVYSPVLECGIAFAYVDAKLGINTPCTVDLRGAAEPATIVSKRFYKRAG